MTYPRRMPVWEPLPPEKARELADQEVDYPPDELLRNLYESSYFANFHVNGMADVSARLAVLQCALAKQSSKEAAIAAQKNEELQTTIKNYTWWLLALTIVLSIIGVAGIVFSVLPYLDKQP